MRLSAQSRARSTTLRFATEVLPEESVAVTVSSASARPAGG